MRRQVALRSPIGGRKEGSVSVGPGRAKYYDDFDTRQWLHCGYQTHVSSLYKQMHAVVSPVASRGAVGPARFRIAQHAPHQPPYQPPAPRLCPQQQRPSVVARSASWDPEDLYKNAPEMTGLIDRKLMGNRCAFDTVVVLVVLVVPVGYQSATSRLPVGYQSATSHLHDQSFAYPCAHTTHLATRTT